MNDDDFLTFVDETPASDTPGQASPDGDASSGGRGDPWRVLVVDDDKDVHETTAYALRGLEIAGRSLQLLHAYSGREAVALLRCEPEVAIILLDVVMETDDAGLVTVEKIRGELGMHNTRIILRTGQPGQAPEIETIRRYDINDYKTKSELTRTKLYTSLTTAIRSYDQLRRLDASRRGLEQIVSASNQFIAEPGLQSFAEGVITQIASLIGIDPAGLLCACVDQPHPDDVPDQPQYRVIAAAGRFRHLIQHRITEIGDQRIVESLSQCLRERHSRIARHSLTLFFGGHDGCDFAAFVDSALPLQEIDQHLLGVFCTNIALCAANVKLVAQLREQAYVDRLLGLPNRTAFIRHLDQSIEAQAMAGRAVALIDVDCFAETNDMFGHSYGDLLLAAISARLVSALPDDCLVARVAGDTFGVFGTAALVSPKALNPLFDEHFVIDGVQRAVSVCMGFVRCNSAADSGLELIKDASIAIKRAKAAGQGRYEYYSQSIGDETRERTRLLHGLQQAFDNNHLFVFYQPQVALPTGRAVGVEVLLRWRRDDGRFVPPEDFIPVAENSGLIVPLGAWVMRTAMHALVQIGNDGGPELRMAVNVSPSQLGHPGFIDLLDEALRDTGARPEKMELEITESVAVMGMSRVTGLLGQIKARGIEVAIDDFGTGYSSLSYIDCLPADRLKIDRSFVSILDSDRRGARIAQMIVALGRQLGMTVLAEGVETEAQVATLRELGCHEAQGFLYARPMPLDELLVWLQNNRREES